ncbi:MAG TPA: hypothetical protein DIV46_08445 [Verrucomicrobiales bacterium]|nr:hypothetical protein [Verrucomicrobiales bacterium]|tara:strand:- start:446 stop:814 length:369 start_codon:yes stop_codon:yes gene_type:complete
MHAGGRPTKNQRSAIGERISKIREEQGISQVELAKQLEVSQQTVAAWERKIPSLRSDTIIKLAEALKVTPDEILGFRERKNTGPKGKLKTAFDKATNLPRSQQKRIIDLIEDIVTANQVKNI